VATFYPPWFTRIQQGGQNAYFGKGRCQRAMLQGAPGIPPRFPVAPTSIAIEKRNSRYKEEST
jgi:hypothetical protein